MVVLLSNGSVLRVCNAPGVARCAFDVEEENRDAAARRR